MKWDISTVTGFVSVFVAISGAILAWVGRRRDSTDKRLDMVIDANEALVASLQTERAKMGARIELLENDRDDLKREVGQLREMVIEQSNELILLRQRARDLQEWSIDIMAWVAEAIGLIRGAGLKIEEPAGPPTAPRGLF